MTTAKPQQVNDQPEAADDLIAELAKLMAQDAQGDRRDKVPEERPAETQSAAAAAPEPSVETEAAEDSPPAAEPFAFRLPGDAAPAAPDPIPTPRFDFGPTGPVAPAPAAASPAQSAPEPFAFDFGLTPRAPAPQAPAPEAVPPVALDDDHDAIGDLIAAQLGEEIEAAEDAFKTDAEEEAPEPTVVPSAAIAAPQAPVAEPRVAATDGFRVAPVFGLGGPGRRVEPAPPPVREAPPVRTGAVGQDPIDDIETLIGDAIRVQGEPAEREAAPEPQAETRVSAAPALRSLATPVLPQARPASRPEPEPEPLSAEETILAAAAATGAQVGWADGQETDFETATTGEAPRTAWWRSGMLRALAGPAIAVVLLLAAGVGLYSVLGLGGNDGPPPVLTADAEPVKEVPEPAAETATPQSVVFNEISGTSTPAESEQLVSRDQSQASEVAAAQPVDDASAEGLVNRKVRTVTVRPDGTIVGGEDSVAGAAMLPVDRPNVPAVPGAAPAAGTTPAVETASAAEVGAAGALPENPAAAGGDPLASLIATAPANGAAAGTTPAPGPATAPIALPAGTTANSNAPVPMPRIERPSAPSTMSAAPQQAASQPTSSVNAVIQGTLQPVGGQAQAPAQQQAAVTQQASTAPAYVQLSSQRSEEAAQQTAASLQSRFGNLFGGTALEVQRVDLGERGIYYRVRLPAQSLENATQICNSVKAGGGDCFTL